MIALERQAHCHTVLLVDDTDDIREALTLLLTTRGFHVVGAGTGAEAIAHLEAGLCACVMLLDLRMPEMDGWEVLRRMEANEALADTPVVLLTGDSAHERLARGLGIGQTLLKPVDPDQLIAVVERHCPRTLDPRAASTL